jgi:RIO-like serine/threonine protein kinase
VTRPAGKLLKADHFGTVHHCPSDGAGVERAVRDTRNARWWIRPLARYLARREVRALRALHGVAGVPRCRSYDGAVGERVWIPGEPMQRARPHDDAAYFRKASALLRRLHRRNVVHNDLAKEPNWLVTPTGEPALVDFQLASVRPRRGRLFRALAHDDIRHLLKHKRSYAPAALTARERRILAIRSLPNRIWMASGKRVYSFVTRRLLHWADREGAGDRVFPKKP